MCIRVQSAVVLICVSMIAMCGCQTCERMDAVPHSAWNPNYWENCLADNLGTYPQIFQATMFELSDRSGSDEYWRLVSTVLEASRNAEEVIVMEQLAEDCLAYYYWLVVARSRDRTCLYANTDAWFTLIEDKLDLGLRRGVVNSRIGSEDSGKLFAALDGLGVWNRRSGVYGYGGDNPTIGMGALAVHIYRKDLGVSIDWVIVGGTLTIDSSIVRGTASLHEVPEISSRPAATEMPADTWEMMTAEQQAIWAQHYRDTYPARLVVNGVLRLLLTAVGPPPAGK